MNDIIKSNSFKISFKFFTCVTRDHHDDIIVDVTSSLPDPDVDA